MALGFIAYHSVQDMEYSEGRGMVAADRVVVVRDAGPNDKCRAGKVQSITTRRGLIGFGIFLP